MMPGLLDYLKMAGEGVGSLFAPGIFAPMLAGQIANTASGAAGAPSWAQSLTGTVAGLGAGGLGGALAGGLNPGESTGLFGVGNEVLSPKSIGLESMGGAAPTGAGQQIGKPSGGWSGGMISPETEKSIGDYLGSKDGARSDIGTASQLYTAYRAGRHPNPQPVPPPDMRFQMSALPQPAQFQAARVQSGMPQLGIAQLLQLLQQRR